MDQLVGFLLHTPLSEIGKKNRKNVEIHPHFQSAFGTAGHSGQWGPRPCPSMVNS